MDSHWQSISQMLKLDLNNIMSMDSALRQKHLNSRDIFIASSSLDSFIKTGQMESNENKGEDLFLCLRPFLIFGKFIGLVPIEGCFQQKSENLQLRKTSFSCLITILVATAMMVNSCVTCIGMFLGSTSNVNDYAWTISTFVFYSSSVFVAIYFYRYSTDLIQILREWNKMQVCFSKPDLTLSQDVKLVTAIVMASAVLENVVGHLTLFPVLVPAAENAKYNLSTWNASAWETYYVRSHQLWANVIPFNIVLAVFVFVSNKIALYAWNYMDLTIVILARAMYFKFKALSLEAESSLLTTTNFMDVHLWSQFTKDHQTLCQMLGTINSFLSPLILLSYGKNIYFICIQMHLGLTPQENTSAVTTIYAFWSFLHLIARVYLINEAGARIHLWAHKATDLFRKCPNEAYATEVERTERFVSTSTISLTGMGCFNITKPLILRVIGIVFTFEVVLLQASQTPVTGNSNGKMFH